MLHLVEETAPVALTPDELRDALRAFGGTDWEPAGTLSERHFLELAGAPDLRVGPSAALRFATRFEDGGTWGDVFFTEVGFFFVTNGIGPEAEKKLRIGGLGEDPEAIATSLASLKDALQRAVHRTFDGRRTRHMRFDWKSSDDGDLFERLLEHLRERGAEPAFKTAELSAEEIAAATVLAERHVREVLKDLLIARFARTTDILARRGGQKKSVEEALSTLGENDLIAAEYTLQCRKTSASLTQLTDLNVLESTEVGALKCASCLRPFKDELVVEGYRATELGTTLLNGSHWMTVMTTAALVNAGAPLDGIRWGLEENGDEIDIVLEHLNRIWVFELKDREFGPGDAHPFNYRRARYRASHSVVVTTDRVSQQAKDVFADSTDRRNSRVRRPNQDVPMYIEGLDKLADRLTSAFASATLRLAMARANAVTLPINVNLSEVLASRFE